MFWEFNNYKGANQTFLGMEMVILEYNKLAIGMKSYILEDIYF